MRDSIRLRRGKLSDWNSINPVLDKAEIGIVFPDDPTKINPIGFKIGNGLETFSDLPFSDLGLIPKLTSDLTNNGEDGSSPFATQQWVLDHEIEGLVDSISINGGNRLLPDSNKNINLPITKSTVGLSNVENYSPADMPISTATQGALEAITILIPSQASSENQLADKEFVNSSISTNTANFIGTFSNVSSLNSYSGTVTNNDYAFVTNSERDFNTKAELDVFNKALLTNFDYGWVVNGAKYDLYRFDIIDQEWYLRVTNTDKAPVTLNIAYNRYKAVIDGQSKSWLFEYTLNNSSFTANQWAAINSGITAAKVEEIAQKVDKTTTVAGIDLQDDITAQELAAALDIGPTLNLENGNGDYTLVQKQAENKLNVADAADAVAFGDTVVVHAFQAFGTGYHNTINSGSDSAFVNGNYNTVGDSEDTTNKKAEASAAFGASNTLHANYSFAANSHNKVTGVDGAVFGDTNESNGYASFTIGQGNKTNIQRGFTAGHNNTNDGDTSAIFGTNNTTSKGSSFTIGKDNTNNSSYGFVGGLSNTAETITQTDLSGVFLHGIGLVKHYNDWSVALGRYNADDINIMFAVGNGYKDGSVITRKNAFTVLTDGRAKVQTAPSDNDDVVRKGDLNNVQNLTLKNGTSTYSLVQKTWSGEESVASGDTSVAFGKKNSSLRDSSFTAGWGNTANGAYSAVFGTRNSTTRNNVFITGRCNEDKDNLYFVVGNGEVVNNVEQRQNAFEVYVDGSVKVYKAPVSSNDVVRKQELDTKQNTLTFDSTPTQNSTNPVTSGGVYAAIANIDLSNYVPTSRTIAGRDLTDDISADALINSIFDIVEVEV